MPASNKACHPALHFTLCFTTAFLHYSILDVGAFVNVSASVYQFYMLPDTVPHMHAKCRVHCLSGCIGFHIGLHALHLPHLFVNWL